MFAPNIRLPNIPGAPQDPSEWEAALLDSQEGFYGPFNDPFFARTRIIPTFYEPAPPVGPVVVIPELPVERPWEYVYPDPPTVIREVLPGPEPVRAVEVPRAVVIVGDVSTEVEQHEEGDFPAGSIFAPGQTWGGSSAHDFDDPIHPSEEEPMAHDWGHLIRQVGGEWLGVQQEPAFNAMGPAFMASPTAIPSGSAALPPSAATVMNGTGGDCGNRRYVTLDRTTGKISCKRRRRRRLLTNRDLADLASLKTITGGGAALNAAVIRAVR